MTKINGDKPIFQYSHSCPIFSYCLSFFLHRLCSRPPAASWQYSHFCPLWDMSTALLPAASPSSLSLAGPAGWRQGRQGRHKASCQISDKQLARAEELAESGCWLCCAGLLAGAVAASMLSIWKPSPALRKAALLNSLPLPPLLAYTARTPQGLLQEQVRGFLNAVWPTHWRKLARNLSDELTKGSDNISAAGAGTCEYLPSHSSFLSAGFSLCLCCL